MDTFGILSPDGHPLFVADLPNERGSGNPHHQYVRSEQELQRFIAARDKPGRALYYTVAHLAEGGWRSKENVVASHWVWAEVDFKDHPGVSPEEILRRINAAPRRPNLITFSWLRLPRFLAVLRANRRASGRCTATARRSAQASMRLRRRRPERGGGVAPHAAARIAQHTRGRRDPLGQDHPRR